MKNLILSLLVLSSPSVLALDVTFTGTDNFIKVEPNKVGIKNYVRLSACEVAKEKHQAICQDLANIEKSEFKSMRKCAKAASLVGFTSFEANVILAIVGGAASGGVIAIPAAGMALYSIIKTEEASFQSEIFSEENENDQDVVSTSKYENFVKTLEKSLQESIITCDVSGNTLDVSKVPYLIRFP